MRTPPNILLVDDDHDIRLGTKCRLHSAGYSTLEASSGVEGIELAHSRHPDAIVMDVRMPSMDGLEALQVLQEDEQTRNIPVVMLSASPKDEQTALEMGARYFLRKPYAADTLLAAMRSVTAPSASE